MRPLFMGVLKIVEGVIPDKPIIPINAGIYLSLKDGMIYIRATDGMASCSGIVAVQGTGEGKIVVPGALFVSTIKSIGNEVISVRHDGDKHKLYITSDKGKYVISTYSPYEFMLEQRVNSGYEPISIPNKVLHSILCKVLYSVSTDELSPELRSAFMEVDGNEFSMVSSNTISLCLCKYELESNDSKVEVIIPDKTIKLLTKLYGDKYVDKDGDTIITYDSKAIRFDTSGISIVSVLVDGKFPLYRKILPAEGGDTYKNTATFNVKEITDCFKRLYGFTNDVHRTFKFELSSNKLNICAQDKELGHNGSSEVNCEYEGEDIQVVFNASIVKGLLSNIATTERVVMRFEDATKPFIFYPEGAEDYTSKSLLSPILINS